MKSGKLNPQYSRTPDLNTVLLLHGDGIDGYPNAPDSSASSKLVTVVGNTHIVNDGHAQFNGSSQYLTTPASADFDFGTGDFTIDFWCKPTTAATGICGHGGMSNATSAWKIYISSGIITCYLFYGGSYVNMTTTTNVCDGLWHHVAFIRSGATLYFYIDGVQKATAGAQTPNVITSQVEVGRDNAANYYAGMIKNFRVSKGIARWASAFTPPTSYTVDSYTKFLLTFHNGLTDDSGNGKPVTNVGGCQVAYVDPAVLPLDGDGGALFFNGISDYLTVADSADWTFGTGDFTLEMWVNFSTLSGSPYFLSQWASATSYWQWYLVASTGKMYFTTYSPEVGTFFTTNSCGFTTGVWYHIAIVRSGSSCIMFVNGVSQAVTTQTAWATLPDIAAPLMIGSYGSPSAGYYFNGYMDEVKVSKGVARYIQNFVPSRVASLGREEWYQVQSDPLDVLLLHMDGPDGSTTVRDSSITAKSLSATGSFKLSSAAKKLGVASALFNGTTDSLAIADSADWYWPGAYTVEMWVNFNTVGTTQELLNQTNAGQTVEWEIGVGASGILYATSYDSAYAGAYRFRITAPFVPVAGVWYHIAVVRLDLGNTPESWRMFVNGVQLSLTLTTGTWGGVYTDNTGTLKIGTYFGGGNWFNGYMDELRITKGYARYTKSFTPPTTPAIGTDGIQANIDSSIVLLLHGDGVDGSNTVVDSSVSGRTVSSVGTVQIANDGRLLLDGSTQYLTVADSVDWAFGSSDFTIDFSVRFGSVSGLQAIYSQATDTNNYVTIFYDASGYIRFTVKNAGTFTVSYLPVWNATVGVWYHIALVRSGSVIKFFVNGVQVGVDGVAATVPDLTGALNIGNDTTGNGFSKLNGSLKNFRVSVGVARWTSSFNPPTSYTTDSYTKLFLQFHGNLTDDSGTGKTVTNVGSPIIIYPGILPLNSDGGAIYFNGATDYLSVSDSSDWSFGSGDFTWEAWIRTSNVARVPYQVIMGFGDNNGTNLLYLSATTGLSVNLYAAGWGTFLNFAQGNANGWSSDVWYHVAFVRKGNVFSLYRNGVLLASTSGSWTCGDFTLAYIGTYPYSPPEEFFYGYMSEIRVSKGIARYSSEFTPATVPFKGFEEAFYRKADPRDVLLLHMEGVNGGSVFTDSSISIKSGFTATATTVTTDKRFGTASALFNGSTSRIDVPNSVDFDFGAGDFTIEFWCKPDSSASANNTIVYRETTGGANIWNICCNQTSNNGIGNIACNGPSSAGGFNYGTAYGTLMYNSWHHVAIVRRGTGMFIYIDGVDKTVVTTPIGTASITTFNQPLTIGCYRYAQGQNWDMYKGYIDELRITKGIAKYTSNFTPPTEPHVGREGYVKQADPLDVLLLHFDDGDQVSGVIDSSASSKIVTVVGGAKTINPNNGWGCASFNGSSSYLTVPDSSDFAFALLDFTIDFWVKLDAVGAYQDIWYHANPGYTQLYISTTGVLSYYNSSATTTLNSVTLLSVGVWYHVAVVRSGTKWVLYINGVQESTVTATYSIPDYSNVVKIGGDTDNGFYLSGLLKNFRVTTGQALWTSGFIPPTVAVAGASTKLLLSEGRMNVDSSGTGKVVTNNNALFYPTHPPLSGGVLALNGSNGYLTVPDSTDWPMGINPFTIEFWVHTDFTGSGYVMSQSKPTATYYQWMLGVNPTNISFYVYNATGYVLGFSAACAIAANSWSHVAMVRVDNSNSSSGWRVFLNGVLLNPVLELGSWNASIPDVPYQLQIGMINSGGGDSYFKGYLANVRISNGIARYISNFTPATTKTVGREDVLGVVTKFPGFVEILDFTATGAESSVSVAVDGDTDEEYLILARNLSASNAAMIRINGETVYGIQYYIDNGGAMSAGRQTAYGVIADCSTQELMVCRLMTPAGMNKGSCVERVGWSSGTTIGRYVAAAHVLNNVANIKSISCQMDSGNFTAGSRLVVYAKRGAQ